MTPADGFLRAKRITEQLHAWGYPHAEAKFVPEAPGIVCNFVLVAASPSWRKPLIEDPDVATAERFIDMFVTWQRNMREALAQNRAGPHLAGAIAAHGSAALKAIGQATA